MRRLAIAAVIAAAACSPITRPAMGATAVLHPYSTVTASPTGSIAAEAVIPTTTPAPSPTAELYTIKSGDTLSQIAERLRVSVDALVLANPGLSPNVLPVGATLTIPSGSGAAAIATPTPAALGIMDVDCRPMATGAAWCFALVRNDSTEMLENVTGTISIRDPSGGLIASQDVALLLDGLPPGAALPLAAPFSGPLPLDLRPEVRILSAMQLPGAERRFLAAGVDKARTMVSWSGLSAEVSGQIMLPAAGPDAARTWVAAVAYDEKGSLVGWRRWESSGVQAAGTTMQFQTWVYSLGGAIQRVDLILQSQP